MPCTAGVRASGEHGAIRPEYSRADFKRGIGRVATVAVPKLRDGAASAAPSSGPGIVQLRVRAARVVLEYVGIHGEHLAAGKHVPAFLVEDIELAVARELGPRQISGVQVRPLGGTAIGLHVGAVSKNDRLSIANGCPTPLRRITTYSLVDTMSYHVKRCKITYLYRVSWWGEVYDVDMASIEVKVHQVRTGGGGLGYSTKHFPASDTPYAEIMGETSIAEEFAEGKTLRSQSWRNGLNFQVQGLGVRERLIAGAENMVELTARYEPAVVGGAVDTVLVSRKTGVVWIRRKPECTRRFGQ